VQAIQAGTDRVRRAVARQRATTSQQLSDLARVAVDLAEDGITQRGNTRAVLLDLRERPFGGGATPRLARKNPFGLSLYTSNCV
jgi:hypothetical protein